MNEYDEWDYEPLSVDELSKTEIGRWSLALEEDRVPLLTQMKSKAPPMIYKDVKGTHPYLWKIVRPALSLVDRIGDGLNYVSEFLCEWVGEMILATAKWSDHQVPDRERYRQENPDLPKHQWGMTPIVPFETVISNYPDITKD